MFYKVEDLSTKLDICFQSDIVRVGETDRFYQNQFEENLREFTIKTDYSEFDQNEANKCLKFADFLQIYSPEMEVLKCSDAVFCFNYFFLIKFFLSEAFILKAESIIVFQIKKRIEKNPQNFNFEKLDDFIDECLNALEKTLEYILVGKSVDEIRIKITNLFLSIFNGMFKNKFTFKAETQIKGIEIRKNPHNYFKSKDCKNFVLPEKKMDKLINLDLVDQKINHFKKKLINFDDVKESFEFDLLLFENLKLKVFDKVCDELKKSLSKYNVKLNFEFEELIINNIFKKVLTIYQEKYYLFILTQIKKMKNIDRKKIKEQIIIIFQKIEDSKIDFDQEYRLYKSNLQFELKKNVFFKIEEIIKNEKKQFRNKYTKIVFLNEVDNYFFEKVINENGENLYNEIIEYFKNPKQVLKNYFNCRIFFLYKKSINEKYNEGNQLLKKSQLYFKEVAEKVDNIDFDKNIIVECKNNRIDSNEKALFKFYIAKEMITQKKVSNYFTIQINEKKYIFTKYIDLKIDNFENSKINVPKNLKIKDIMNYFFVDQSK